MEAKFCVLLILCSIATAQQQAISMDYFVSLAEGIKVNDYVPNSLQCVVDLRNTQEDILGIISYFQKTEPGSTVERIAGAFFNVTGQLTNSIPDAVYHCYDKPQQVQKKWLNRLAKFSNLADFEEGFAQNLMGNVLTFQDIAKKINIATTQQDYQTVTYQIGRLLRRVFDFEPMQYASLHKLTQGFDKCILKDIYDYNRTTTLSITMMITEGFVDGAFRPPDIQACLQNSIRFFRNETLYSQALIFDVLDEEVWYATRLVKQFYPMSFYCYHSVTESIKIAKRSFSNSPNALFEDLTWETPEMMDNLRIMDKIWHFSKYLNKDYYVFSQSAGNIARIITTTNKY